MQSSLHGALQTRRCFSHIVGCTFLVARRESSVLAGFWGVPSSYAWSYLPILPSMLGRAFALCLDVPSSCCGSRLPYAQGHECLPSNGSSFTLVALARFGRGLIGIAVSGPPNRGVMVIDPPAMQWMERGMRKKDMTGPGPSPICWWVYLHHCARSGPSSAAVLTIIKSCRALVSRTC